MRYECSYCGNDLHDDELQCPGCGARKRKAIERKWRLPGLRGYWPMQVNVSDDLDVDEFNAKVKDKLRSCGGPIDPGAIYFVGDSGPEISYPDMPAASPTSHESVK